MSTDPQADRRRFSDEDIQALCEAITKSQAVHFASCRFGDLTPRQVENAVKFHTHIEALLSETGSTIRKTVLTIGITGLLGLLVLGIYSKLKSALGI